MKPLIYPSLARNIICASTLAVIIFGAAPKVLADVCVVCYDDKETVSNGIHFCRTSSGEECGNNVIIAGTIVATGYKTVDGCGSFWGNPHHTGCTGTDVGACP